MTYKEAIKTLKLVGCAHAKGDALRAMYAQLVSFHCRVDGPKGAGDTTKAIYQHLQTLTTDRAIHQEADRFLSNPVLASDVAFLPLKPE